MKEINDYNSKMCANEKISVMGWQVPKLLMADVKR